ncbi:VOC family protein [Herbiconiux moechotypicola]|uniref:VOC family protein n=1 Tax=Herbiconiux moechotypicola TaxID=637393 RepID=A0ABP5QFB2_9MICO|nr:VOC family protein [Herbiconiux moechotypicola]MCS5729966.1 VOC family protein [Herbiconiux moechotypicola]
MSTNLNPYISFKGEAKEAMEFYRSVLGGELTASTFDDFQMPVAEGEGGLVMHSQLVTPGGLVLMGSDTPTGMDYTPGTNVTIAISGEDIDELRGYFDGLSEGGTLFVPFEKAPWGDYYGQFTDKFGIVWMVNGGSAPQ